MGHWTEVDQHPGQGCCKSCLEDYEYDSSYRIWDYLCCCVSEVEDDSKEAVIEFDGGLR